MLRMVAPSSALAILVLIALSSPVHSAPNWDVVAGPRLPGSESLLRAVEAVSDDEAWAVGTQQTPSYDNRTLVAHYVNGVWTVVPSPNPGPACTDGNVVYGGNRLNALEIVSPTDIWAVGTGCLEFETLIEHWNGSSWSIVPSPNPLAENILSDLTALGPHDVWAVGHTEEDIGAGTLVEHWNGVNWSVVPSPKPGTGGILGGVDAVSASDIWSTGSYYDEQDDLWETLVEHWNGASWSVVPSPSPGTYTNALGGVAVVSANDVWTVGSYSSGAGVLTLAEHWDGQRWEVIPTPNVATGYGTTNSLGSVVARATDDVWAAGMFQNEQTDNHQSRTLLMHWDGASWSIVPSPSPGKSAALADIAFGPSGEAWGVGIYSEYPIDIYDGHYTLAQALTVGKGPDGTVNVDPGVMSDVPRLGYPTPNPAAGQVSFALHLPVSGDVALSVFDVRGHKVRSILADKLDGGERTVTWDGRDAQGVRCRSGFYYIRLAVGGRVVVSRSLSLLQGAGATVARE
jgi:hypothetical protein